MEPYLMLDINRYIWFRFVISDICVHCMRYKSDVTVLEMVCPFCKFQFKMKYTFCCVALALTISDVDTFNQSISIFRLISFNTAFTVKE